jgi:NAD(P)-dependent dehydrogenase (short-subunit alcohol dehydrogenase family)
MRQYEYSKLCLQTWVEELARRHGGIGVHAICPGPVATDLARESPAWVKPVLYPFMRLFFLAPARAAEPVLYLAAAPELEGETGRYLHMTLEKAPAAAARDPELGRRLWAETSALIAALA